MNEKGLSSVFVILRVVYKLVECSETYKYFKRKRSTPYAAKGRLQLLLSIMLIRLLVWIVSIKAHGTIAEFNLVQCLKAKIPHRTAIRVIFQFQSDSWISVGDF